MQDPAFEGKLLLPEKHAYGSFVGIVQRCLANNREENYRQLVNYHLNTYKEIT